MAANRYAAEEAEIRQQIDRYVEAIRARDIDGVKRFFAPDIVSFDVQPPLRRVGVEGKVKNWAEAFAVFQAPLDYEARDVTITVGGDVAFVHLFGRLSGTVQNETRTGPWVRATLCLRKIDGSWLVAHDHASVPLDMASGKGLVDLEP